MLATFAMSDAVRAQQLGDLALDFAMRLASEPPRFDAPFNDALVFPEAPSEPARPRPSLKLLDLIASWLAGNFDLQAPSEPPRVEFVSPAKLVALRYRGWALHRPAHSDKGSPAEPLTAPRIEGLYDDRNRVIYLSDSWQGETVAEHG